MNNIQNETLASIVKQNHQTVKVLEKYSLDFCCKGKRTLAEACIEKQLPVQDIATELMNAERKNEKQMPFNEMNAEQLISYVLIHHHFYVKQSMPTIFFHIQKVASKHGDRFPYMRNVEQLFAEVMEEMTEHMIKEEKILFPRIKELEANNNFTNPAFIENPIHVMEADHEHVGNLLYEIRNLTNNYIPPAGACTTFQVCLAELKEFEEDLHQHVHMENNILFPLAQSLATASVNMLKV